MIDLLVEMAVREISTQCTFAKISYGNIDIKAKKDLPVVFSSIHSFLSHCAMVSKFLWSKHLKTADNRKIATILGISGSYKIKKHKTRNALEHYDKHLKDWVAEKGPEVLIYDFNIGPKKQLSIPENSVLVRHYEPEECLFTMLAEELKLDVLFSEVEEIKRRADSWIDVNITRRNR